MTHTPLTRTDINALRQADSVTFHYNARTDQNGTRSCFVRAHKRVTDEEREHDPFAPYERTHTIDLGTWEDHRLTDYGNDYTAMHGAKYSAFVMIHSASVVQTWLTIARSLKVGEEIVMHWTRDNNNQLLEQAGLHRDQLEIAVGMPGKPARYYLVDVSTSLDNSARMIQPA